MWHVTRKSQLHCKLQLILPTAPLPERPRWPTAPRCRTRLRRRRSSSSPRAQAQSCSSAERDPDPVRLCRTAFVTQFWCAFDFSTVLILKPSVPGGPGGERQHSPAIPGLGGADSSRPFWWSPLSSHSQGPRPPSSGNCVVETVWSTARLHSEFKLSLLLSHWTTCERGERNSTRRQDTRTRHIINLPKDCSFICLAGFSCGKFTLGWVQGVFVILPERFPRPLEW